MGNECQVLEHGEHLHQILTVLLFVTKTGLHCLLRKFPPTQASFSQFLINMSFISKMLKFSNLPNSPRYDFPYAHLCEKHLQVTGSFWLLRKS